MLVRSETLKDEHVEFILNSYPNKTTEYFCHVELGFYNCLSGILSHNLSVYNQAFFVKFAVTDMRYFTRSTFLRFTRKLLA